MNGYQKQASGYFQLKEEEEREKRRKELYERIQKEKESARAKLATLNDHRLKAVGFFSG